MKNGYAVLVLGLLACSCSRESQDNSYDNPAIGLHFSYSASWQFVEEDALDEAISTAQDTMEVSQEVVDVTREVSPLIVLSLMKPNRIDGANQNATINVIVLPVPAEEWKDMDLDQIISAQILDIKHSFRGVEIQSNQPPYRLQPRGRSCKRLVRGGVSSEDSRHLVKTQSEGYIQDHDNGTGNRGSPRAPPNGWVG